MRIPLPLQSGWISLLSCWVLGLRLSSLDTWLCHGYVFVWCASGCHVSKVCHVTAWADVDDAQGVCQTWDPTAPMASHKIRLRRNLHSGIWEIQKCVENVEMYSWHLLTYCITDPSLRLPCKYYMAKPTILEWIARGWSITTSCHHMCHSIKLPASAISTAANCDHNGRENLKPHQANLWQ